MPGEGILNVRFLTNYVKCQFHCPYCIAAPMQGDPAAHIFNEQALRTIVGNLVRLPHRINIRLGVLGEFFLSPALIEAARQLTRAENTASVNCITNLGFSAGFYRKALSGWDLSKVGMVASLHPTEVRRLDAWLDTARELDRALDFAVTLVGYPPLLPGLPALVDRLRGLGLSTFIQGFVGDYQGRSYPFAYTQAERELLRRVSSSRHDYAYFIEATRPGLCHAGQTGIFVDMTGQVRPCGMGARPEVLGNLLAGPELALFPGPRPCPRQTCLCDTENINTASFAQFYEHTGPNQHKFRYRFADLAATRPECDEWRVRYP
jgi:MoaA/NifB/PqqE/SkfB family radical SAM enzyme